MPKRFGVIESDGPGTIITSVGPRLKPDFLATLLDCGMPNVPDKVFTLVTSKAIVKLCGPECDGFNLCYFGIREDKCGIRTGVPLIEGETQDGIKVKMVVWARAVSWRDAWAYFLNFYDAKNKLWRMLTVRVEMDKPLLREQIGHKLVDGMKLVFMQFEGFVDAAARRDDDISKEDWRQYCINSMKAFAKKYTKLNITNLASYAGLNRDTVSKYMKRDPTLLNDLRTTFSLYRNDGR
jgi:hypothetical protein